MSRAISPRYGVSMPTKPQMERRLRVQLGYYTPERLASVQAEELARTYAPLPIAKIHECIVAARSARKIVVP